jgi:hypothetical protein
MRAFGSTGFDIMRGFDGTCDPPVSLAKLRLGSWDLETQPPERYLGRPVPSLAARGASFYPALSIISFIRMGKVGFESVGACCVERRLPPVGVVFCGFAIVLAALGVVVDR